MYGVIFEEKQSLGRGTFSYKLTVCVTTLCSEKGGLSVNDGTVLK